MISNQTWTDTIVAPATAPGVAAISVIRLSGSEAIAITNKVFKGRNLDLANSHTIHFGTIRDGETVLDEVVVSLFKAPKSFTKEDVIEISCHGSPYIVQQMLALLLRNGARMANPGEFTLRAFLNGRFDLSQAEAVADLIHSDSEASRNAALNQMRGGVAKAIQQLRSELLTFAALIELELDFGEEDVEFADRAKLAHLLQSLLDAVIALKGSFAAGNVMKNGVPVAIVGKPNAGKSTLLNRLLQEEKALVSDIPGTTRDFIEDVINIQGYSFRFIDTAGLRQTTDTIEAMGVQRTLEKIKTASVVIYLFDASNINPSEVEQAIAALDIADKKLLCVANKSDLLQPNELKAYESLPNFFAISALGGAHIDEFKNKLVSIASLPDLNTSDVVITNYRHFEKLRESELALRGALSALESNLSGDLLAQDLRHALHYLGHISGEITTDDILGEIFGKFCIGK